MTKEQQFKKIVEDGRKAVELLIAVGQGLLDQGDIDCAFEAVYLTKGVINLIDRHDTSFIEAETTVVNEKDKPK